MISYRTSTLQYEGVSYHSYADDIMMYIFAVPKILESVNHALLSMSNCIEHLQKWMESNMLKLNCDKTEFLVVSSPQSRQYESDITLTISDISIQPASYAKSLSVDFDSD